ncbi:MAG: zinc-ribbon domain containing protein [Acidobacteriota bacterium]
MTHDGRKFEDKNLVCSDCAVSFPFTADEQKFYQDKGFANEPKRCKPCRTARKSQDHGTPRAPRGNTLADGPAGVRAAPIFKADFGPSPTASSRTGYRQPRGSVPRRKSRPSRRQTGDRRHSPAGEDSRYRAAFVAAPWDRNRASGRAGPVQGAPRTPMRLFQAVCSDCGADTEVPFRPNGISPVYCRTCLPKHRPRKHSPGSSRGRDASAEE